MLGINFSNKAIVILFFFVCSYAYTQEKHEIGVKICLQTPKFWNGSFTDITTPKDGWIRPAFGVYTKYHIHKLLFIEYDIDLSFEGGGFSKRKTNLSFVKNTLFLGISTNTSRKNSFNLKIGGTHNALLKATLNDQYTNLKTEVSAYFRRSSISFPFSVGYVRRIGNQFTMGFNTYFQIFSGPLSIQDHIEYAQTIQRFELKLSKFITTKQVKK